MTVEIRGVDFDTFSSPEDQQARSAVLLRFPCEHYHKGITKWINDLWERSNMPAYNKPVRIHCKAGSASVRLVLKHEANAKTLLGDIRMMVFLLQLTVPSVAPVLLSQCVNPDQLKTERLENNLRPCGKCWLTNLKILFPDGDDEGVFNLPALDARSQILSIKDRQKRNGKLVFKLDPLVSGQTFTLVTPDLSVPGISLEVLQRVLSQASTASCVMAAPSPHRFFAAWRVEALFLFFPISMGSTFGGPFDSRFYFV